MAPGVELCQCQLAASPSSTSQHCCHGCVRHRRYGAVLARSGFIQLWSVRALQRPARRAHARRPHLAQAGRRHRLGGDLAEHLVHRPTQFLLDDLQVGGGVGCSCWRVGGWCCCCVCVCLSVLRVGLCCIGVGVGGCKAGQRGKQGNVQRSAAQLGGRFHRGAEPRGAHAGAVVPTAEGESIGGLAAGPTAGCAAALAARQLRQGTAARGVTSKAMLDGKEGRRSCSSDRASRYGLGSRSGRAAGGEWQARPRGVGGAGLSGRLRPSGCNGARGRALERQPCCWQPAMPPVAACACALCAVRSRPSLSACTAASTLALFLTRQRLPGLDEGGPQPAEHGAQLLCALRRV